MEHLNVFCHEGRALVQDVGIRLIQNYLATQIWIGLI